MEVILFVTAVVLTMITFISITDVVSGYTPPANPWGAGLVGCISWVLFIVYIQCPADVENRTTMTTDKITLNGESIKFDTPVLVTTITKSCSVPASVRTSTSYEINTTKGH